MYVCVCMRIYVYACMYVCMYACVCVCMRMYVCMCMYAYVYVYVYVCVCIYIYIYIYICVNVCVCMRVCVNVCMSCNDFINVVLQMFSQEGTNVSNVPQRDRQKTCNISIRIRSWVGAAAGPASSTPAAWASASASASAPPPTPAAGASCVLFFVELLFVFPSDVPSHRKFEVTFAHPDLRSYMFTYDVRTYVRTNVFLVFQSLINTYIHLIKYGVILIRLHGVRRRWQLRQKHR